jgi:hypothetical protein
LFFDHLFYDKVAIECFDASSGSHSNVRYYKSEHILLTRKQYLNAKNQLKSPLQRHASAREKRREMPTVLEIA